MIAWILKTGISAVGSWGLALGISIPPFCSEAPTVSPHVELEIFGGSDRLPAHDDAFFAVFYFWFIFIRFVAFFLVFRFFSSSSSLLRFRHVSSSFLS